ncbi:MAG: tetratricopeptide repeat protein [Limnohabitans sp.]|nr:tetratricopeptide repeat protein [Limnohabitans sp.]
MNKKIIIYFFLFSLTSFSQDRKEKIEHLIEQFNRTVGIQNDSAYYYITKAYAFGQKSANDSLIASTTYKLGHYYFTVHQEANAIRFLNLSIKHSLKSSYFEYHCKSNNYLGIIASQNGDFNKALSFYLKALKISENQNSLSQIHCAILNNLGNLYIQQKDTIKAINYYKKNIGLSKHHSLQNELMNGYISLAIVESSRNKPFSIENYKKALDISKKTNDLVTQFTLHINLSDLYLGPDKPEELKQCFYHLTEAQKLQKIINDSSLLFYIYFNLGGYHFNNKNFEEAIKNYNKALQLVDKGYGAEQKMNLYKSISKAYFKFKNFEKAYIYKELHQKLSDSLFTIEKNKTFNEIQTKFDVDKKNLKITVLQKEKAIEVEKSKNKFKIMILLVIVLITIIYLLYHKNKTQKILQEKERQKLQQEKEIKRILGQLEGEEKERNRIAKEIHDGLGGKLASIKMELNLINKQLSNSKLNLIIETVTETFSELRAISHNLSSHHIANHTLVELLYNIRNEYQNNSILDIEVAIYPEELVNTFPFIIKNNLYRIIQELLNNIVKHSGSKEATINLTVSDEEIILLVEDYGIGFENQKTQGIGLQNINERISLLNGTINIDTVLRRGTTISVFIPYK